MTRNLPLLLLMLVFGACAEASAEADRDTSISREPPSPRQVPHVVRAPFGERIDPYHWLRDDSRQSDEIFRHLNAENRYARGMLDHLRPAMGELLFEMQRRVAEQDCSVPVARKGWFHQSCTVAGRAHPVHVRRANLKARKTQTLLDVNELAAPHRYFAIGTISVSPDNRQVAWTEDRVGQRRYLLRVRDIASGKDIGDPVADVESAIAWTADGILYVAKDPRTLSGNRIMHHRPGHAGPDRLVHAEPDPQYFLTVRRSRSDRFLLIGSSSTQSTEWRVARSDDPALAFSVVYPREPGHEYEVEDHGQEWILLSNWQADNFRVLRAPMDAAGDRARWREWIPHDPARLIESMTVLKDGVVVAERSGGLRRLRAKLWSDGTERAIDFPETSYVATAGPNPEYASPTFRLVYSSLSTPGSVYDYHLADGTLALRKREPVRGKFRPGNYVSELVFAPARDGRMIPVSLLYRKRVGPRAKAPMLVTGYGAYGTSSDPHFNAARLSLIDRGVLFAIAHVRGGEEMGRSWYAEGRQRAKMNSFTDFIDATDWLVREGWADPGRIVAQGGSAGGLLVAGVANMAPDRYKAIVANVPFVDVVTSMLDANLPLTAKEYGEWGNPSVEADYRAMLEWSPYDNVRAQRYPAIMATTGLFDTQVPYWEPAKWIARLRELKQSEAPVILMTNLYAGHATGGGRYKRLKEQALASAYILDQLGVRVHITKKRHVDWPKKILEGEFRVGSHNNIL